MKNLVENLLKEHFNNKLNESEVIKSGQMHTIISLPITYKYKAKKDGNSIDVSIDYEKSEVKLKEIISKELSEELSDELKDLVNPKNFKTSGSTGMILPLYFEFDLKK